jgi:hypothetical protein
MIETKHSSKLPTLQDKVINNLSGVIRFTMRNVFHIMVLLYYRHSV